jgi:hypothetical protein
LEGGETRPSPIRRCKTPLSAPDDFFFFALEDETLEALEDIRKEVNENVENRLLIINYNEVIDDQWPCKAPGSD